MELMLDVDRRVGRRLMMIMMLRLNDFDTATDHAKAKAKAVPSVNFHHFNILYDLLVLGDN